LISLSMASGARRQRDLASLQALRASSDDPVTHRAQLPEALRAFLPRRKGGTQRWYADNAPVVRRALFFWLFGILVLAGGESLPLRHDKTASITICNVLTG
jgi:hypothetical protein